MKVKMTKIKGGERVRTETVIGTARGKPVVGEPFVVTGKPLNEEAQLRVITTSPVVSIDGDVITTYYGSQYKIENMAERN